MPEQSRHPVQSPTTRGVHHLALCSDDMKATIDFYVDVLGMPLVHAMKVPPGLGTGPGNRGNPPYARGLVHTLRRRSCGFSTICSARRAIPWSQWPMWVGRVAVCRA